MEKGFYENEKSLLIFIKVNNFNRLTMVLSIIYWIVGNKFKNSRYIFNVNRVIFFIDILNRIKKCNYCFIKKISEV